MADYAITGKKGTGKSLFAVGLIRDALRAGKRVATNLDIYPEAFGRPLCKAVIARLPDRPTVDDFEALGRGQDGVCEDDNGIIVLDETSTFFGSRQFGDKSRQPMLDWLVHSRKYGWDVYYIMQGLAQVDKQIRDTQIEYHIGVLRTDKWPIPVVTPVAAMLGFTVRWPKLHIGVVKYGTAHDALRIDRKWYRGRDLYRAYDTQQVFVDREHPKAVGLHSVLSSWHVKGRYMSWWQRTKPALAGAAIMGAVAGVIVGGGVVYAVQKAPEVKGAPPVDESRKVIGSMQDGGSLVVVLSDGKIGTAREVKRDKGVDFYLVDGKWLKQ